MVTLTSADEWSDDEWQVRYAEFADGVSGRLGSPTAGPVFEPGPRGRTHAHVLYAKPAEFVSMSALRAAWPYGCVDRSASKTDYAAEYMRRKAAGEECGDM